MNNKLHVGVVGAGAISDIYLENMIHKFDILCVDKICARHPEHAQVKQKNTTSAPAHWKKC